MSLSVHGSAIPIVMHGTNDSVMMALCFYVIVSL